jgi:hypothetical protein
VGKKKRDSVMKCLCGYEDNKENFINVRPDEEKYTEESYMINFQEYYMVSLVIPPDGRVSHSIIFACPKCGTLKVELPL